MPTIRRILTTVLVGALAVFTALYIQPKTSNITPSLALRRSRNLLNTLFVSWKSSTSGLTRARMATSTSNPKKTPIYFVSHGGPSTMYEKDHPVHPKLQALGREINDQVKPDAIVVFSAHWQSDLPGGIEVNVSEDEPLLYDFYGFPRHYYQEKFPNRGSKSVSTRVLQLLKESGINARGVERGLDHGVFVPFKVMFDSESNPLQVPIVQVSLFDDDSEATAARLHFKLGEAVAKLREENVVIVVSGMAVHNLRHMHLVMGTGKTLPYAVTFDTALKEAVEKAPGDERYTAMEELLKRIDARQAHPTFEHLLPIHVGAGAAKGDAGKQVWTMPEGSMSWAQYRFGTV